MITVARLLHRWATRSRPTAAPSPLRPEALPPGTRLGDLCIERPIGRGATGALYAASDAAGQTLFAVKVLCPGAAGGDAQSELEARTGFLQAAERASQLVHPGIVRVFGGGSVQGLAFVVMELLPGTDLTRYTQPARLLPEAVALSLAARLAEALAHAHRSGVVHRDVKPANVMFDAPTGSLRLTDFGLARSVDAEATRSGVLLGSPAYMAPELLAGSRANAHSDLYALGVLLFELLTGRLPYAGDSMGALLRAMATQAPQSVRSLRPDLPAKLGASLDAVLALVLARAPADRLGDGDVWAHALRQAMPL